MSAPGRPAPTARRAARAAGDDAGWPRSAGTARAVAAPAARPPTALQRRWRAWLDARHPRSDTLLLTHRNVYILPTKAGWAFAATLLVLLVASIQYQLSLGYLLTFLLAGSGVVSMHVTHNNLRGLSLRLRPVQPGFVGEALTVDCVLADTGARARHGIAISLAADGQPPDWSWIDVPAGGESVLQMRFVAPRRGSLQVPDVRLKSRFPLGLFRAWSEWRLASTVLAYPRPEQPAAPLPPVTPVGHGTRAHAHGEAGEFDGVRGYRRGDPLKLVVWKKAARALEGGGDLVSRDARTSARHELWLDWSATAGLPPEARLSRLSAWVLASERSGADWGLRLPGLLLAPARGPAQRRGALEALAQWQ